MSLLLLTIPIHTAPMHALVVVVALLVTAACAPAARTYPAAPHPDVEAVLLANARFDSASVLRDPIALDRLLADDFVHVNYTGTRGTKPAIIRSLTMNRGFGYAEHSSDSVEIRLFGPVAVMNGIMIRRGDEGRPEDDGTFRFTRVWVKTAAGWRVTANQYTTMSRPPGR